MPQFSYKARRRSGELVEGVLETPDRSAALVQIQRSGLFPISVADTAGAAKPAGKAAKAVSLSSFLPPSMQTRRQRKPKLQELATFTTQLANLLNSGMPLTLALNSMSHLETKGIPASVSKDLRQEVTEGRALSDAMLRQPVIFSDLYINMVRAGETSGKLVDVLRRMATHFQQFADVQAKFKSAMVYPIMVLCFGILLVIMFMMFVMPKFTEIFEGFNIPLPLPTQMLIGISAFFTNFWCVVITGMVILSIIILFKRFSSSKAGKRKLDELRMQLPIFGKVIKINLFGQFARTLGTLLANGVPVLTALKITEQIISNAQMKEAIAKTREAVTDGKTLAQPLAASKLFPQLMVDLVRIGEETGDVPGALNNLADTYENELQIALRVMSDLIGPLLIVVMAIGVGFLLLSIFLPLFKLISSIH